MILVDDNELWYEPRQCLDDDLKNVAVPCEMTAFQLAFLCGLIRGFKPRKLWEIGTAAGGTAIVMLRALELLGIRGEIHSVDLLRHYYKDKSKNAGWFVERYGQNYKNEVILHRGGVISQFMPSDEREIDFVLLDAAHKTPGELMDFLCLLPHLKMGCVVVCHDIALQHKHVNERFMTANSLLYASVVAEKLFTFDPGGYAGDYPNIGAFIIAEDTIKYLENIFFSLICKWDYMPDISQLELVRNVLRNNFSKEMCALFDSAVALNKQSEKNMKCKHASKKFLNFHGIVVRNKIRVENEKN